MDRQTFTAAMRVKGWKVKDALARWGRSKDWYHRNANGTHEERQRLKDMINGLPNNAVDDLE